MGVWERLERLVVSWTDAYRERDPEYESAWDELERYLADEIPHVSGPSPEIRQAYHDLEVPLGSDPDTVRRAYRRLLLRYHPDRHQSDPERQKTAIAITQRLSMAYDRINRYYREKNGGQ
jgi:DnaJ-class molecular chaperone